MATITRVSPMLGPVGQWVYVFGSGFTASALVQVQVGAAGWIGAYTTTKCHTYSDTQVGFEIPAGVVVSSGESPYGIRLDFYDESWCEILEIIMVDPVTGVPTVSSRKNHTNGSVNWVYVTGTNFAFGQTTVDYNGLSQSIPAYVYSPESLGFQKTNIGDTITTYTVTTPGGSDTGS